jgi:hypothetical protein
MPPDNTKTQPLEGEALQAHVTKLLSDHMQDVDKRFSDTMEQLEGLETIFTAKLDAKFQEVLARLPPTPPALQELRVLHRPVMHSWMIITGKMSTRASTRTTSQLISHLVVLGPTFAVHLLVRWYVMMTMLLN